MQNTENQQLPFQASDGNILGESSNHWTLVDLKLYFKCNLINIEQ